MKRRRHYRMMSMDWILQAFAVLSDFGINHDGCIRGEDTLSQRWHGSSLSTMRAFSRLLEPSATFSLRMLVQLSGKTRELEGQLRINEAQKGENDAQAAEIELLRTDILELKR